MLFKTTVNLELFVVSMSYRKFSFRNRLSINFSNFETVLNPVITRLEYEIREVPDVLPGLKAQILT